MQLIDVLPGQACQEIHVDTLPTAVACVYMLLNSRFTCYLYLFPGLFLDFDQISRIQGLFQDQELFFSNSQTFPVFLDVWERCLPTTLEPVTNISLSDKCFVNSTQSPETSYLTHF